MSLAIDFVYRSERLLLRCPRIQDAESLASSCSDPLIEKYLGLPYPYPIKSARGYIELSQEKWLQHITYNFAIIIDDNVAGMVSLMDVDTDHKRAEVGYWLGSAYRGEGLMSEAVGAITDIGFSTLHLQRLWARVDHDNPASASVLTNMGFTQEGRLRSHSERNAERKDELIFGLLPNDL